MAVFQEPHGRERRRYEAGSTGFGMGNDFAAHARIPESRQVKAHTFDGDDLVGFGIEERGDVVRHGDEALDIQLRLERENDADGTPDPYVYEELEHLYGLRGDEARTSHYAALRRGVTA